MKVKLYHKFVEAARKNAMKRKIARKWLFRRKALPLNGEPRYVYLLYGCLPFVASLLSVEKFHEDSQEMLRREDSRM